METITLSLISHTNVGKTTLTRTLLGRDVGEVRDEAHVTLESERYDLIETDAARLVLWDTPGFGDSARLLARLRKRDSPVGWFLHQVWDRFNDRALFSSQQAVRNVSEEADVVLYLVNAAEQPAEAGYVAPELEILSFLDRPLLALLNQTGAPGQDLGAATQAWEAYLARWPFVRGVLPLDAFNRCWVQEGVLFARLGECLAPERRPAMAALAAAWHASRAELFGRTIARLARALAATVRDREPTRDSLAGLMDRKPAMTALAKRLAAREHELWDTVLAEHRIEGRSANELRQAIDDFEVQGATKLESKAGALIGGVLTSALYGLAADAFTGGLSLGGGMLAGAILGALGGAGLSRAYVLYKGDEEPAVTWSTTALEELAQRMCVRYLAVAHFGSGRGSWREDEEPALWRDAAARALPEGSLPAAPRTPGDDSGLEAHTAELERVLDRTLYGLLDELYPGAWKDDDRPQ